MYSEPPISEVSCSSGSGSETNVSPPALERFQCRKLQSLPVAYVRLADSMWLETPSLEIILVPERFVHAAETENVEVSAAEIDAEASAAEQSSAESEWC